MHFYKYNPNAKPGNIDLKLLKIHSDKSTALTTIDPRRMFFESLDTSRFVRKGQFGEFSVSMMLVSSTVFFFSGTLFKFGQKVMEWGEKYITETSLYGYVYGRFSQQMYIYYTGKKFEITDEEKVIKYGVRVGDYWHVTVYYLYGGYNLTEWGNEKLALHFLNRIAEVSESFENSYNLSQWQRLKGYYSIKFRKLEEFLKSSEESVNLALKTNNALNLFMAHCFRSMAYSLRQEPGEANASLTEAEKLTKDLKVPLVLTQYLIARSYIEIAAIKIQKNEPGKSKALLRTTRDLIKYAQKARAHLTEAYRLHALAYLILNKTSGAVNNFKRSIEAGTSYGGNLELSRTYFEAGKFLRDPKNKKERINGMNGTECLLKAKAMFEEMNLQWDLGEYEKYTGNHASH